MRQVQNSAVFENWLDSGQRLGFVELTSEEQLAELFLVEVKSETMPFYLDSIDFSSWIVGGA